jgi:hypothetical protein
LFFREFLNTYWIGNRPPSPQEEDSLLKDGAPNFISWFDMKARKDREMDAELKGLTKGFAYKVKTFNIYDVNGYRFHTRNYEQKHENRKTTNTGVRTPGTDGCDYYDIVEEIYELDF